LEQENAVAMMWALRYVDASIEIIFFGTDYKGGIDKAGLTYFLTIFQDNS